jgi:hypothetical protein
MPSPTPGTIKASVLVNIPPFQGQRDIDTHRVPDIEAHLQQSIADSGTFYFDTPFVLVRGVNLGVVLLSKSNETVSTAILDGQHRAQALNRILEQHPQFADMGVDVYVHSVESLQEAHAIQNRLFKQKPVDLYDQFDHNNSKLTEMLTVGFPNQLAQSYPNVRRIFKPGRHGAEHTQFRRMHLMIDELVFCVKNSPNIHKWIQHSHNITVEAFTGAVLKIIQTCKDKCLQPQAYHTLDAKQLESLQNKQERYGDVMYLTYFYYAKYSALVGKLENELGLVDASSE